MGLITFLNLKRAGRPERMGPNTCKSMGRVGLLCVARRYSLLSNIMLASDRGVGPTGYR